ncbi:MAG TPA: glycosyltransferase family 39 protein [Terriglobales bacterium]
MAQTSAGHMELPLIVETQAEPGKTSGPHPALKARWSSSAVISLSLLFIGVVLRVIQYLHHRSLWFDEAMLAVNLLNRSYAQLLQPLDYNQGAPLGFLFLERLIGTHLGFGEYALRLVPLIAGICSLYLFYRLAQLLLPPRAVWIALGLAAVCPHLIYYSSELKQYSSDVLVATALALLLFNFVSRPPEVRNTALLALAGGIAIWIAHPAVIVLAGMGGAVLVSAFLRRDWRRLTAFLIAVAIWSASFAGFYLISIREVAKNNFFYLYWAGAFMPHDLTSIATWKWLFQHLLSMFRNPGGAFAEPAIICFFIGSFVTFCREREKLWMLLSPVFIALVLSYLGKYPFEGRLLLFLTPTFFLLIAAGVNYLLEDRRRSVVIVGYALLVLIAAQPIARSTKYLFGRKSGQEEEIRPVLQTVKAQSQPGDVCYIYHWGRFQYWYYSAVYHLGCENVLIGTPHIDTPEDYKTELNTLRGQPRVWLVFSHNQREEEDFITTYAMKIGRRLSEYKDYKASAYLFDFSRSSGVKK